MLFFFFFSLGSEAFFTSMNVSTGDYHRHSSVLGLNKVITDANYTLYSAAVLSGNDIIYVDYIIILPIPLSKNNDIKLLP